MPRLAGVHQMLVVFLAAGINKASAQTSGVCQMLVVFLAAGIN